MQDPLILQPTGHLNIMDRAADLFDQLLIGVAVNSQKASFLPILERIELLKRLTNHRASISVVSYEGLTVDFAKQQKISCLIRSLRSGIDLEEEKMLARANVRLGGIETLFLIADETVGFISASLVREIALNQGSLKDFVPPLVEEAIRYKF